MTQGIVLQTFEMKTIVNSPKKADLHNDEFSLVLDKQGSEVSKVQDDQSTSKVIVSKNSESISKTTPDQSDTKDMSKQLDELNQEIVETISDETGLDKENILSILQSLNLTPTDLLSSDNMKDFLLSLHGIQDNTVLLTSETLNSELSKLNELMQSISQSHEELLSDSDFKNFLATNNQELIPDEMLSQQENVDLSATEKKPTIEVIHEGETTDTQSTDMTKAVSKEETSSKSSDNQQMMDQAQDGSSTLDQFTQKLTTGFKEIHQDAVYNGQTIEKIVNQVVEQIRIRVLPDTTSMELQLNPESLGKVNILVASKDGVATATLTCQNETAKTALESQISLLKENLSQQGLKVESVEVNVSEFGFTKQDSEHEGQPSQKKSSHRNFSFATENEEDDNQEQIIFSDSQVNYTA